VNFAAFGFLCYNANNRSKKSHQLLKLMALIFFILCLPFAPLVEAQAAAMQAAYLHRQRKKAFLTYGVSPRLSTSF
jgi:4-amino-4-deoxy-L-arabinose transferase-like glycosyltransferase